MFVRKVADKKTGYIRIQICSNVREGKKVKQKIIRHIWCPWIKKRFCCKNTSIATSCLKISLNFTQYKKCSVLWKNNILYFQVYLLKSCEVGSVAEMAGLQAGDVILEVNKNAVSSDSDVENILQKAKKEEVNTLFLLVEREGSRSAVILQVQ